MTPETPCNRLNCEGSSIAHGLCWKHYQQQRRGTLGKEHRPKATKRSEMRSEHVSVACTVEEYKALTKAMVARGHRSLSALLRGVLAEAKLIPARVEV